MNKIIHLIIIMFIPSLGWSGENFCQSTAGVEEIKSYLTCQSGHSLSTCAGLSGVVAARLGQKLLESRHAGLYHKYLNRFKDGDMNGRGGRDTFHYLNSLYGKNKLSLFGKNQEDMKFVEERIKQRKDAVRRHSQSLEDYKKEVGFKNYEKRQVDKKQKKYWELLTIKQYYEKELSAYEELLRKMGRNSFKPYRFPVFVSPNHIAGISDYALRIYTQENIKKGKFTLIDLSKYKSYKELPVSILNLMRTSRRGPYVKMDRSKERRVLRAIFDDLQQGLEDRFGGPLSGLEQENLLSKKRIQREGVSGAGSLLIDHLSQGARREEKLIERLRRYKIYENNKRFYQALHFSRRLGRAAPLVAGGIVGGLAFLAGEVFDSTPTACSTPGNNWINLNPEDSCQPNYSVNKNVVQFLASGEENILNQFKTKRVCDFYKSMHRTLLELPRFRGLSCSRKGFVLKTETIDGEVKKYDIRYALGGQEERKKVRRIVIRGEYNEMKAQVRVDRDGNIDELSSPEVAEEILPARLFLEEAKHCCQTDSQDAHMACMNGFTSKI